MLKLIWFTFAAMEGIKLPSTIRWAISNCLFIWVAMIFYRGFLLGIFFKGSAAEVLSFFSGMLIDAGVMSFILVIYILICFIPVFHPFKSKIGKYFGYLYFISWGLFIMVTYITDILFVKVIQYRLYGSKILAIFGDNEEKREFLSHLSTLPVMVILFFGVWIWSMIISRLHVFIGKLPRIQDKSTRITRQGWVIITGLILMSISFIHGIKVKSTDLDLDMSPAKAIKTNAVLSFFMI